jgi:hypothetical protein
MNALFAPSFQKKEYLFTRLSTEDGDVNYDASDGTMK